MAPQPEGRRARLPLPCDGGLAPQAGDHTAPLIARPASRVHDLEDAEVPWAEGERYARYWPAPRLLTTTGLGHHRVAHDPDLIAASLRFLRGERVVSPNLPYGFA